MNLIKEIEQITHLDKKNLMATYAKLGEEHGELARTILAYANEPSTLHRYATKQNIVEECIDVALVAISIAIKASATEDDIDRMFRVKLDKWATILQNEGRLKDITNIPFEIHITVDHSNILNFKDTFYKACTIAQVKPISLNLINTQGETIIDNMTSSKFFGTNSSVLEEVSRISKILKDNGLTVIREKVETVPWHPLAPQSEKQEMPKDCYFEAHIEVHEPKESIEYNSVYPVLEEICKDHNAHFSKNINKTNGTRMNTIRVYTNRIDFDKKVNSFLQTLNEYGLHHEPVISEFSLYDTKITHDKNWLT